MNSTANIRVTMAGSSVYQILRNMDKDHIVFAYKGEINADLLETVYSMLENHFEEKSISTSAKKKFFQVLIESLQNVLHHQVLPASVGEVTGIHSGFLIKTDKNENYSIITGNLIKNSSISRLQEKLDEVNNLTPENLKTHYQQALAKSEFSEKGGAGLGIIEMARKSGHKLKYEFTRINNEYSFFSLTITL